MVAISNEMVMINGNPGPPALIEIMLSKKRKNMLKVYIFFKMRMWSFNDSTKLELKERKGSYFIVVL